MLRTAPEEPALQDSLPSTLTSRATDNLSENDATAANGARMPSGLYQRAESDGCEDALSHEAQEGHGHQGGVP